MHYSDIGIVEPVHKGEFTSFRYYSASQLSLVNKIHALKDMGFSLSTIKEILETYGDADSLKSCLKVQQSQIKQETDDKPTLIYHKND